MDYLAWRKELLETLKPILDERGWVTGPVVGSSRDWIKDLDVNHQVRFFVYSEVAYANGKTTAIEVLLDYPVNEFYNIIKVFPSFTTSEEILRWFDEDLPFHLMEPPVPKPGYPKE